MNLDMSIFILAVGYFTAAIFMVSAAHKLLRGHAFRNSLSDYNIIPHNLVRPITLLLSITEISIVISILSTVGTTIAALFAIFLLTAYGAMLSYGLISGRANKGCGCEWGDSPQPIKPWMIWRNAILILMSMMLVIAGDTPTYTLFNIGNALGMTVVLFIIYSSMTGIFSVDHRIKLIRKGV